MTIQKIDTKEEPKEKLVPTPGMTLEQFEEKILALNETGRTATLKHHELFGKTKDDKPKAGHRYHMAGTDPKCPFCLKIIDAHNAYQRLQGAELGVMGIQLDSLIHAMHITRATVRMMKNGGEL